MSEHKVVRIGFVGLGTVGQGVWKHLEQDQGDLERRLGARIELVRAAVRDPGKKDRRVKIDASKLTTDALAVARDPSLDIVCELMGGIETPKQVALEVLRQGKVLITANKALLCEHGKELFEAARQHNGRIFFEGSVCGGIPIIKALSEGLVANRFPLIYGILNGTCNYILTRIEREGKTFDEILRDAQAKGYADSPPDLDIDGWDTAHKAVILTFLAHGVWVNLKDVEVEGIRKVTSDDIMLAKELGDFKIKLFAIIQRDLKTNKLSIRVHPTLVDERKVLARVDDVFNAVSVTGDVVGTTTYIGRGAGSDATASAVISDIVDAVIGLTGKDRNSKWNIKDYLPSNGTGPEVSLAGPDEIIGKYYFRFMVTDETGILAKIATAFANNGISLSQIRQQPRPQNTSSLIMTTHTTSERSVKNVLAELERTAALKVKPFYLRVADFDE